MQEINSHLVIGKNSEQIPSLLSNVDVRKCNSEAQELVEWVFDNIDEESQEQEKVSKVRMVCALWVKDRALMERQSFRQTSHGDFNKSNSLADLCLKVIVKVCRDDNRAVKLACLVETFALLDALAVTKNPASAQLYKLLTFVFIQAYADSVTREFISSLFLQLIRKHRKIPIKILLEPLLRQLQASCEDGEPFELLNCDVLLFRAMLSH